MITCPFCRETSVLKSNVESLPNNPYALHMLKFKENGKDTLKRKMEKSIELYGEKQCESLIEVADREEFQLGPLFTAGGRWWSLVGQTWKDPKRELHEFIPLAAIPPKSSK